ncbi:NADH-quinone oxidoreductase subunit NuoH [ANME-2 cluster archaeon]|nr:MAG: NADH-quinone oxidoreductase subunit NuoH [ANME-2 cluster archaeon]
MDYLIGGLYYILGNDTVWGPWIRGICGLIAMGIILVFAMFAVWLERKYAGDIQSRIGPNRVGGSHGELQLIADAIKLFTKEDLKPDKVDTPLWAGAPILMFGSALLMLVAIPFGAFVFYGRDYPLAVTQFDVSILYLEAVSAIGIVGIFMAGWGSNNKFSVIAAFRNMARMIGYEVPLGLTIVSVAIMAHSLNIVDIVSAQSHIWYVIVAPLGFVIFMVSLIADLGRIPFDQNEAEEELIAGWATEYSGMRFGLGYFAEYIHMVLGACITVILFFGGWNLPGILVNLHPIFGLLPFAWFVFKVVLVLMFIIMVRWALPRIRIDQVTTLGWKVLLPLALLNLAWTSVIGVIW